MTQAGIYIHIPFCISRCTYCDFYSTTGFTPKDRDCYGRRILHQLDEALHFCKQNYRLVSLYIGGGSPSTMPESFFAGIADILKARRIDSSALEFTIEANPADLTTNKLDLFLKSGANRLSLGIQSFDDAVLARMGRRIDVAGMQAVLPEARKRFANLSVDMIYGFGNHPRDMLKEFSELFEVAEPDHISAYSYMRPEKEPAPEQAPEEVVEQEEMEIARFLKKRGFNHYEVSNWARNGRKSRHNMLYWTWGAYFGIGAAAHGFFPDTGERLHYRDDVRAFLEYPAPERQQLYRDEQMKDFVMMGLRLTNGFSTSRFKSLFGVNFENLVSTATHNRFIDTSLAKLSRGRFQATRQGVKYLNQLIVSLFEDIEQHEE